MTASSARCSDTSWMQHRWALLCGLMGVEGTICPTTHILDCLSQTGAQAIKRRSLCHVQRCVQHTREACRFIHWCSVLPQYPLCCACLPPLQPSPPLRCSASDCSLFMLQPDSGSVLVKCIPYAEDAFAPPSPEGSAVSHRRTRLQEVTPPLTWPPRYGRHAIARGHVLSMFA
jgi:hypothetical protein